MTQWMKIILAILGFPKSLWINFRSLPFLQAVKIPILVSPMIKIVSTKGKMKIQGSIHTGMISFGLTGYGLALHEPCVLQNYGLIIFQGKNRMGGGTRICCNADGVLTLGYDNEFVGLCSIICSTAITFGDRCLVSWDTQFMDSDMHHIMNFDSDFKKNSDASVNIGNHVWICSKVNILKGTTIEQGSIIGGSTVVTGDHIASNCLVVGIPAKVIKQNVAWTE